MYDGRIRRLHFTLSDEDLDEALDLVSGFNTPVFHWDAWEDLITEAERRQEAQPPQDIVMSSSVFDTLPAVVQAFLFNHVSPESRRAA